MDMNENKRRRSMLLYVLIAIIAYLAISQALGSGLSASRVQSVDYSKFVQMVENDEVTQAESIYGNPEVTFTTGEGDSQKLYSTVIYNGTEESTAQLLDEHGVQMVSSIQDTSSDLWLMMLLSYGLPILIFLGIGWWLNRRMKKAMGDDGPSMNFGGGFGMGGGLGKSNAKKIKGEETGVTFKDVAGQDEAKESLEEIVSFLKHPDKYTEIGARCPRGALLVGPPGTGKTLLAKAVAGEAGVPFFQIAGSEFVEMFVGRGAAKVRDLFKQANEEAPCIVFIDEIDAVGKRRDTSLNSNDEREQTLNQLLVEMDGFASNEGVIVLAATNRADILDPALLRPGRFDRQIYVGLPDIKGREEILRVHARNKPLAEDVDLHTVAQATVGFTGADLENLLNEAALLSAREHRPYIRMDVLHEAMLKVIAGPEKKSRVVPMDARRLTAYHEAGHAVVIHALKSQDPVHQITIIPRGPAGGMTISLPEEDRMYQSRTELQERICTCLGGRVAEELVLGDISTGASNDLQTATAIARSMVTKYGMSDRLGAISYDSDQEVFIGRSMTQARAYSEEVAGLIDEEIKALLDHAYARCREILSQNRQALDRTAEYLLEFETMSAEDFALVFDDPAALEQRKEEERKHRLRKAEEEKAHQTRLQAEREAAQKAAQEAEAKAKAEAEARKHPPQPPDPF